jgi:carbonic anhydrase
MSIILNLQTKDKTLNNVISNNPYYIDIKGSVNICLIRCGQDIESCNSVNFDTMTNYGKILVLNKKPDTNSKCAIKLAFDNTNDNMNNEGNSNYNFENAFFTVPSLHRLNGVIYDMETFLVFSSVQKNGNILYVCLCTFSNGTNNVKQDDWKLLNYKLIDELFLKNNTVPDMYGTSQIKGIPNPVDVNNFIPKKGFRNFYDYTHPLNTKVNFRVFQTPLSVSSNVLDILKSKLTPGNIYTNFKLAIGQSINPLEGLFFYFSEDLTDRYKSFAANNSTKKECITEESKEKKKDHYSNKKNNIIEEEENNFKKLKVTSKEKDIIKEEDIEKDIFEDKKSEKFQSKDPKQNGSYIYIFFIVSFMLIVNYIYKYLIDNYFKNNNGLDQDELIDFLKEINDENIRKILGTKFKLYVTLIIQTIITAIILILLVMCIYYNNYNISNNSIFSFIGFLLFIIAIIIIISLFLYFKYFFYRGKLSYDDNITQKESYFYNYLKNETYKNNLFGIIKNLSQIFKEEDFTSFYINIKPINQLQVINQTGGTITHLPHSLEPVPGSEYNNNDNKDDTFREQLDKITKYSEFFYLMSIEDPDISVAKEFKKSVAKEFKNSTIYIYLISYIVLFYFLGTIIQFKFLSTTNAMSVRFIGSFLLSLLIYIPVCFLLLQYYHIITEDYEKPITILKCVFIIIIGIIFLITAFFMSLLPIGSQEWHKNGLYIISISLILICLLIPVIAKYIPKFSMPSSSTPPNINNGLIFQNYAILTDKYNDLLNKFKFLKRLFKKNENRERTMSA